MSHVTLASGDTFTITLNQYLWANNYMGRYTYSYQAINSTPVAGYPAGIDNATQLSVMVWSSTGTQQYMTALQYIYEPSFTVVYMSNEPGNSSGTLEGALHTTPASDSLGTKVSFQGTFTGTYNVNSPWVTYWYSNAVGT